MGAESHKRKIIAAWQGNDYDTVAKLLYEWQESGQDAHRDPLFFLMLAKIHSRNGKPKAVAFNIDKALELMGK